MTTTVSVLVLLALGLHTTTAFITTAGASSYSRGGSAAAAGVCSNTLQSLTELGLDGTAAANCETARGTESTRLFAATGFFESLFGGKKAGGNTKSAETARLSEELFDMLSAGGGKPDDAAVMEKIEGLEAAPGVSFNKNFLYDGPWRVLWKTNTAWQRYFDPLKSVADNRAYQWYKEDGSVTNIAQALGDKLYVTVDGQGTPASRSTDLPYEVNVEVSRAWLHALGGKIPLDFIKGKGTTFVVYNDARLRIFRSDTGGVVVQTKANEVVPV